MNKKFLSILVVAGLCAAMAMFVVFSDKITATTDADPNSNSVGQVESMSLVVLDVQAILSNSEAANNIKEQARELSKSYQDGLSELEKELKASHEKIISENKDKSREDKIKAAQGFEKELMEANKEANDKRRALENAVEKATQQLRTEVLGVVAKMATENGYDMVLSKQDVVIVAPKYDITRDVMKRLNSQITEVKLTVEN